MLEKGIKYLTIFLVFIFPLVYIKGFAYPGIFPRAMLVFLVCELLFFLFLWYSLSKREFTVKRSNLIVSLFIYVFVLFISAILGSEFGQSFWSSFSRMTGIITWLHYLSFLIVVGSLITLERDWRYILRALLLSGFVLAIVSFLGVDGLALSPFSLIKEGGSLFGNTSYSGAYYLLVFFISLIGYSFESNKAWKGVYIFGLVTIFLNPDLFNFAVFQGDVAFSQIIANPMILFGLARMSMIVLCGGLLTLSFLFLLHKFVAKKLVVITSVLILLSIFTVYLYGFTSMVRQEGKIYDSYTSLDTNSARSIVWNIATEGIKERPLLGYGPENFNYVYQRHLNFEIITIESSTEWFDRAHNFTLDQIVETGFIGGILLLVIFILIVSLCFRLYIKEHKFYFLIIPFIFLFHFLQMQTFFQTDSALFLVFLLLAFLVSHEANIEFETHLFTRTIWTKLIIVTLFVASIYFFVRIPMKENLLISKISTTQKMSKRFELHKNLCCLKVYPAGELSLLSSLFTDNTAPRADVLKKAGVTGKVAEEYRVYLEAYKRHLPRYEDNYRYLIDYANMINVAFMFGVDELKYGEELLNSALDISGSYPHPYWFLAVNFYYQRRDDEALSYAKQAYDIDPTIKQSIDVLDFITKQTSTLKSKRTLIYLIPLSYRRVLTNDPAYGSVGK